MPKPTQRTSDGQKLCSTCKAEMIRVDARGRPATEGGFDACPRMLEEYSPEEFAKPYRRRIHPKQTLFPRRSTERRLKREKEQAKAAQIEILPPEELGRGAGWVYAPKKSGPGRRVR